MSGSQARRDESPKADRTKSGATRSRKASSSEKTREKRPNIFKRMVIFVSQVVAEMKKVVYPSGSETWTYFIVVIVFVAAVMAFTGILDFLFGRLSAIVFG